MVVATNSPATHSIAELITDFYKTTGNVPPPLIGATTTLVHQHIYVFGGRVQSTRQISNRVYILSLKTKAWKTVQPQNTPPTPRYFHSADYHEQKNQILIYGGMGVKKSARGAEELVALDDLVFLNIQTMGWEYHAPANEAPLPSPRYAHVSSLIRGKLIVIGGQDVNNQYLQDMHIFDIKKGSWCAPLSSRQHQYGAYRSAAVAVTPIELTPPFAPTLDLLSDAFEETQAAAEEVADISIHVYSNFSGSEVTRYLHTWKVNNQLECVEMQDQSDSISVGTVSPPALRFPAAFMCGQQFILAGPHFTPTSQQFQIWALDTNTFAWTKIEAGPALSRGSWLKGMLCQDSNRFIVFGHPERSMQVDYKDRVNCFEHMACVDIEIFGIYRPPRSTYSGFGQGLGLTLLKDPILADLTIVTVDQQHIAVNSAVLAQRWPIIRPLLSSVLTPQVECSLVLDFEKRELHFPDTYVVLIAFLQFIYTDHLVTAQQHQPHILARLLFIADLFELPRLKALATHALHQMLNIQTATMIYESASLSNAVSLQIRALRVMINAKKMMQRQKMLEMNSRQQQQVPKKQPELPQAERPFSPPPTPASASSIFSVPPQQQQQPANSSRFLQKYDINRHQQQKQQSLPSTPMSAVSSFSSSSQASSSYHHRSPSQRSLSTESHSAPAIPTTSTFSNTTIPTTGSKQAIKLPNFRMRQASSTPQSSDGEYSPLSSAASSPKITPSTSSTASHKPPSTSRSATSFWRQNTTASGTTLLKKKSTTPSKSEGTTRMPAFNFIK
ncbi:unnamed protein product [Mucor fragilis]